MSTSSKGKTPSPAKKVTAHVAGVEDRVISTDWNDFALLIGEEVRGDFASWLTDELDQMEQDLEAFVSNRVKLTARR